MLSKITTLISIVLAAVFSTLLVNFLRLDWQKGRVRGLWAGLVGSLIKINLTIFAIFFRTGINIRSSTVDVVSADQIISSWPSMFITLPLLIIIFTFGGWIMEPFLESDRHRRR
jgi:hypothetical protein